MEVRRRLVHNAGGDPNSVRAIPQMSVMELGFANEEVRQLSSPLLSPMSLLFTSIWT